MAEPPDTSTENFGFYVTSGPPVGQNPRFNNLACIATGQPFGFFSCDLYKPYLQALLGSYLFTLAGPKASCRYNVHWAYCAHPRWYLPQTGCFVHVLGQHVSS